MMKPAKSAVLLLVAAIAFPAIVRAEISTDPLLPSFEPVDLSPLDPQKPLPAGVVTSNTISQTDLTLPSLWLSEELYFRRVGAPLVENWIAYPEKKRVDLVVNQQVWNLLNYLERYQFLDRIGNSANDFSYNLRIFSRQKKFLAAYTCDVHQREVCKMWWPDLSSAGGALENMGWRPDSWGL